MADEKKTEEASEEEPKKKGPLLWIILAILLGLGGVGAGIFLAPKFMAPPPAPPAAEEAAAAAASPAEAEEPPITVQWPPLVVDVLDEQGGSRHVKVVITLEAENEKFEEEIRAFGARGRQAVLGFVRSQPFEEIVGPDKFEELQKKVDALVKEQIGKDATGKERVQQVLLTDLVAQ